MENLVFDSGIKEYRINERGVLRFNTGDPNVYARFMEAIDKMQTAEAAMVSKAQGIQSGKKTDGELALQILAETDREMKNILAWVFGEDNDFNQIFEGVNLMAVGSNGERVITNFISAIMPILEEGAKKCADEQISAAVAKAQQSRAERTNRP